MNRDDNNINSTIYDIARQLGYSPSTVSRALRDHPEVKPETKQKIIELANQLNYHPNPIALSLRTRRSHTIGVIVPEIKHYFFSSVISGIEDIAYKAGYTIFVSQSHEKYEREVLNIDAMIANQVKLQVF